MVEISGDRRAGRRYRLELPLRYRVVQKTHPAGSEGVGITLNMSSGGVAFEADTDIAHNSVIEVWITWPTGGTSGSMELHAVGTVVRMEGSAICVKMKRHEFVSGQIGSQPSGEGGPGNGSNVARSGA